MLDYPGLFSKDGGIVAVVVLIFFILLGFLLPSSRYNQNGVIRIGKSRLRTIVQWDSPPWLSLGTYIKDGYSQVGKTQLPFST